MYPIRSIPIVLLMAASSAALADWTKVTKGYQSKSYVDLGSRQKTGDIASMDVLIDYDKVPFDGNNLPYLSLKMKAEYNCATKQFRTVKLTSYSGHMATGDQPYTSIEPDEWQPVLAKHTQDVLWEMACQKKFAPPIKK